VAPTDAASYLPPRSAGTALTFALIKIPAHLGYLALAALVGVESAGIPVPGETALIAAGLLAHRGQLDIVLVVATAAVAAIVGDNIGYLIGRKGGRALLTRPGPMLEHRARILAQGGPFFERHGAKAVFLGRWFAGLRIAAAWLAGTNRMHWPTFMFWNALGGIAWAITVGTAAYLVGPAAEKIFKTVGVAGLAVAAALIVGFLIVRRVRGGHVRP
jgi:membrane-associated protein